MNACVKACCKNVAVLTRGCVYVARYTMLGPDLHELMSQHPSSSTTAQQVLQLAHHSPSKMVTHGQKDKRQRKDVSEARLGIIPRAIGQIFDHVRANEGDISFTFYCSYIEIYSEKVFDLLQ